MTERIIYQLKNIKYVSTDNNLYLFFERVEEYRTIVKYKQVNYVRHPIYSELKYKRKPLSISLKLTNENLENLDNNENEAISENAFYIISKLKEMGFTRIPSWYQIRVLKEECNAKRKEAEKKWKNDYDTLTKPLTAYSIEIAKLESALDKAAAKYYRRSRLFIKTKKNLARINLLLDQMDKDLTSLLALQEKKKAIAKTCAAMNVQDVINPIQKEYDKRIAEIKPLPMLDYSEASTSSIIKPKDLPFIGLNFFEAPKPDIMGVYIIHNKENDKYYVGQSKNVGKRVRQHFNGTEPQNIIFAKDYYESKWEHKEDLFEIAIIPCSTKDELDAVERENIAYFDSFESGYNRTRGNK